VQRRQPGQQVVELEDQADLLATEAVGVVEFVQFVGANADGA
jgi:hypothetical protein